LTNDYARSWRYNEKYSKRKTPKHFLAIISLPFAALFRRRFNKTEGRCPTIHSQQVNTTFTACAFHGTLLMLTMRGNLPNSDKKTWQHHDRNPQFAYRQGPLHKSRERPLPEGETTGFPDLVRAPRLEILVSKVGISRSLGNSISALGEACL
jgi:hypothetical protein